MTALSVASLIGLGMLAAAVPAQASPLSPGLGSAGLSRCARPFASATVGLFRVTCGVGAHRFVVPAGVHVLQVDVSGAAGGSGGGGAPGGAAERVRASIMVSPGEVLELVAGGAGLNHERGGFNGGGNGPTPGARGRTASGGGGGESDVRIGDTGPWTRIVSAAGGGGGGGAAGRGGVGGNGGRNSSAGQPAPGVLGGPGGLPSTVAGSGAGGGTGGTAGGAGNTAGLIGGSGGIGAHGTAIGGDGGGGGGGYGFGGGGAGGASTTSPGAKAHGGGGGGGGGGSSYVNPAFLLPGFTVLHLPGVGTGNGTITVSYRMS